MSSVEWLLEPQWILQGKWRSKTDKNDKHCIRSGLLFYHLIRFGDFTSLFLHIEQKNCIKP